MFLKGSKLYSILFLKCPRCHKGEFYTGSMYVSYAVGIAVAVATYVLSLIFNLQHSLVSLFISIVVVLILTMPWIAAVSKSIWANMFFTYDNKIAKNIN